MTASRLLSSWSLALRVWRLMYLMNLKILKPASQAAGPQSTLPALSWKTGSREILQEKQGGAIEDERAGERE